MYYFQTFQCVITNRAINPIQQWVFSFLDETQPRNLPQRNLWIWDQSIVWMQDVKFRELSNLDDVSLSKNACSGNLPLIAVTCVSEPKSPQYELNELRKKSLTLSWKGLISSDAAATLWRHLWDKTLPGSIHWLIHRPPPSVGGTWSLGLTEKKVPESSSYLFFSNMCY